MRNPLNISNPAWFVALAWLVLAPFPARLHAQAATSGMVVGHIRGPGGVAAPGAKVVLANPQTGQETMTWSNEAGDYVLTGVAPGTYRMTITLAGFRPDVRQPVPVAAGQPVRVNVALVFPQPGAMANGAGGASAGGRGAGFPGNLQNLPGGASGGGQSLRFENGAGGGGGDNGFSGSDQAASSSNSFLLAGNTVSAPEPGDRRQQFQQRRQQFQQYMASQRAPGFSNGGGFDFTSAMMFFAGNGRFRPRINRIRGNLYTEYSNASLDARPYPLNIAQSPLIPSHVEQFGLSLGGPLVIPKIYNGSDKTSFFIHYNRQRNRQPFDSFATVPTVAERAGDFSQAAIPSGSLAGTVPVIYNPFSNPQGPRTPFAGNVIPSSLINPAARGLLQYMPLPNLPGSVQNYFLEDSLPSNNDRLMSRVGYQATPKDNVSVFYFLNSARSQSVTNFPELTQNQSVRSQNVNLNESHTFNPHLLNMLLVNFNRQRIQVLNPFAFTDNIAGSLGITGISVSPMDWGVPPVNFTNFSPLNDVIPSLTRNQTFRVFDFFLINRGKHNLRIGGEARRVQVTTLTNPDARGTFTFSGYTTSNFTTAGTPVANTGFDFADFLLGLPQNTSVRFGSSSNYFRDSVLVGFAQDDWRFRPKLTFNLGLRYEYYTPFTEKYGHLSDLAIGPGYTSVSVVTGQNPGNLPSSLIRGDPNDWSPRFGWAYRPSSQHSLVFRGGYGIFYDNSIYQRLVPNLADQPPFAEASTLVTSPAQVLTLQNGFPQINPQIAHNTYAVDPNFLTPYAETWNFSLEQQLVQDLVLTVGYVGTKGNHLDLLLAPDSAPAGSATSGNSNLLLNALPFTYETSGAASLYNALQVDLRRMYHNGLSFDATYTYSKSMDDAASVGGSGRFVAQNAFNLAAEYALSSFNQTNVLHINQTYELPFGERRKYLNHGGALSRMLENWRFSGNASLASGTPYTPTILGNLSNNVNGAAPFASLRPNATGLPVTIANPTTLGYFNTAAFSLPAAGQYGNAGRDTIPGPPQYIFNMSLDKLVVFSREKGLQGDFRISAENIFNTPTFDGLSTVVNSSTFGRVTSVGQMRVVDLSLRLRF
ncbi:MAG TPA: TonB-dependent receptor [Terriglobia bacterium]|nr:TonB-dependent receptor [Terriglobia bacterium]